MIDDLSQVEEIDFMSKGSVVPSSLPRDGSAGETSHANKPKPTIKRLATHTQPEFTLCGNCLSHLKHKEDGVFICTTCGTREDNEPADGCIGTYSGDIVPLYGEEARSYRDTLQNTPHLLNGINYASFWDNGYFLVFQKVDGEWERYEGYG